MPKGVYARKSAQRETAGKGAAKTKAKAKVSRAPARRADAAKPAAAATTQLAAVLTTPAASLAQPEPQFTREDFRRSVDDMSGPLLHAYARQIGIQQRDVDNLTEDRLRQNCKLRIAERFED